jgi:lipopolysaccharide export system permease protein
MRISPTLTRYITRHFVTNFVTVYLALVMIIYLADSLELLRRASKRADIPVSIVFKMSLLKLPQDAQEMFAFAILFASMYTFWRLTRTLELVVARASGISAWEFLWPGVLAAFLIGTIKITMLNPASSVLVAKYEQLDAQLLSGHSNAVDISSNGLWLRQNEDGTYLLLHASKVQMSDFKLQDVSMLLFTDPDRLETRVDAPTALLQDGKWVLPDAQIFHMQPYSQEHGTFSVATDLTPDQISNNYTSPTSLSFWTMPRYIENMESTGFSAIRVRMQYDTLWSQPLLFAGIVLIAAAITLGPPRRTNTAIIIGGGTIVAFGLFFLNDVVRALGLDEIIPVTMAAWTPAALTLLAGFAALLFLEDG